MSTLKSFCEKSHIPATLIRAAVRQIGGWETFQQSAHDIASHGADGGWTGFCYYKDTVPFGKKIKRDILDMAKAQAEELGEGEVYSMISGFRCMDGLSATEIAEAVHNPRANEDARAQVFNGLAWYALEEVARSYDDLSVQE